MKRLFAVISVVLICVLLSSSMVVAAENITYEDMDYLKSIMNLIRERYKGNMTDRQLLEGAIDGMFNTMDQYTDFYNNVEAEAFFTDVDGQYVGIGIMMSSETGEVCVVDVFDSSPAETAGIMKGDIIKEVEGKSILGKSGEEVAGLIKGTAGTKVTIGLERMGESELIRVDVLREEVKINPVSHYITGDIGYIKLDMFNSNASLAMTGALQEMDRAGISKLILDLRDNPGGEVNQVVKIAESFVPQGLITKLDFKSEEIKDEEYYSKNAQVKYKLVLLVNDGSASASEILAGAVQDTEAGVLVGTTTFGKGKVQNIYPILSLEAYKSYEEEFGVKIVDGYQLINTYGVYPADSEIIGWTKITTGEYYTPNGRMIDGIGLEPDYYIENEYEKNGIDIRDINSLSKKVKPSLNDKNVDVFNAEKLLKFLGYSITVPDMNFDSETFEAVRNFQKDNGFYAYGIMDFSTQQALNQKLETLTQENDKQLIKALELLK